MYFVEPFKKFDRLLHRLLDLNIEPTYLIPVEDLIKRSERRLKINPLCPYCGSAMKFRYSNIFVRRGYPVRDDIVVKCRSCLHTAHFGIPISLAEAKEEIKQRGNQAFLLHPSLGQDKDKAEVRKKLLELGYFDFAK